MVQAKSNHLAKLSNVGVVVGTGVTEETIPPTAPPLPPSEVLPNLKSALEYVTVTVNRTTAYMRRNFLRKSVFYRLTEYDFRQR